MTIPTNEDGSEKLSAAPTGRGARNAKFNGKRPWEWMELNWADILKVRADITNPSEHGVAAWVPRDDERERADSMEDYVGRFVGYMRLGNDLLHADKRHQAGCSLAVAGPGKAAAGEFLDHYRLHQQASCG